MDSGLEKLKYDLQYYKYPIDSCKMNITWYNVFKKLSQAQMLYWHLKTYGKITTMHAEAIYGISHPPKRIEYIRKWLRDNKTGFVITNEHKDGLNRWGKKVKFDEYTLKKGL